MLSEEIKQRVKYLSDNFSNKECRKELMRIINKYLNK